MEENIEDNGDDPPNRTIQFLLNRKDTKLAGTAKPKEGEARIGVKEGNSQNKGNSHKVGGNENNHKVGQEQIHGLLFSDKLSWQAIIYDLINTEQLDVWDVDIGYLTEKYLARVQELEEANFFVSSKVLLAAALLLRMKSEILLNKDLRELDDILFGKKDEAKKYTQERIELDDDVPELVPRTPLPRFRKVSLQELMNSLGKAIQTETRRIKKVVIARQHEIEAGVALPKARINIRDEIRLVYKRLKEMFSSRSDKLSFSEFIGDGGKEGVKKGALIANFVPLLHLGQQDRVVLEQEGHLSEIYIWTKKLYEQKNSALLELMRKEAEVAIEEEMEMEKENLPSLPKEDEGDGGNGEEE